MRGGAEGPSPTHSSQCGGVLSSRLGAPARAQTLSVHCDKNGTQLSEIEHAIKVQILKDQGATCFVSYLSVRQAGTHTLGHPRDARSTLHLDSQTRDLSTDTALTQQRAKISDRSTRPRARTRPLQPTTRIEMASRSLARNTQTNTLAPTIKSARHHETHAAEPCRCLTARQCFRLLPAVRTPGPGSHVRARLLTTVTPWLVSLIMVSRSSSWPRLSGSSGPEM